MVRILCLWASVALCSLTVAQAAEKVEIDNPWVRVLRITQAPHEKSEMHERPASISVYLTDVHQRIRDAVLEYLTMCVTLWPRGQNALQIWIADIKRGSTPNFGNLGF